MDKIFQIDPKRPEAIKAAIMEYGPLVVGVKWDPLLSKKAYSKSVYMHALVPPFMMGGHAMVITGWGTKDCNPYWELANSHGPHNNNHGTRSQT